MDWKQAAAVLDVVVDASWEDIETAYSDLITVWHPDRFTHNPDLFQKANDKLKLIHAAREVLRLRHASQTVDFEESAPTEFPFDLGALEPDILQVDFEESAPTELPDFDNCCSYCGNASRLATASRSQSRRLSAVVAVIALATLLAVASFREWLPNRVPDSTAEVEAVAPRDASVDAVHQPEAPSADEPAEVPSTEISTPTEHTHPEPEPAAVAQDFRRDGQRRYSDGDYAEALRLFDEAIRLNPTEAAFGDRAVASFCVGKFTLSVSDCTEVIQRNPSHANAHYVRSLAQARLGNATAASKDYAAAVALNPQLESKTNPVSSAEQQRIQLSRARAARLRKLERENYHVRYAPMPID